MTLHWWMHWFWVTSLLILFASSGRISGAPQSEELQHMSTDAEVETPRPFERQGRAMYYTKSPHLNNNTTKITLVNNTTKITLVNNTTGTPLVNNTAETNNTKKDIDKEIKTNATTIDVTLEVVHPSIQWTGVNSTERVNLTITDSEKVKNVQFENVTVTTLTPLMNLTQQNLTLTTKKRNLTRIDIVKDGSNIEGIAESRIVTDKPLSLEIQTRIPPNIESSRRVIDQNEGGMDTGAIAGIAFAALVLAALAGSTAFVLYRRRYLNKPQTLNDKCSNPDSSGYLDDSTIRDNSEEMYSLDNDSFLNSLEAMTIQNYWTDTVKHTKL